MSLDGLEDAYLTEGNVNGDEFLKYVRPSLLPLLMFIYIALESLFLIG